MAKHCLCDGLGKYFLKPLLFQPCYVTYCTSATVTISWQWPLMPCSVCPCHVLSVIISVHAMSYLSMPCSVCHSICPCHVLSVHAMFCLSMPCSICPCHVLSVHATFCLSFYLSMPCSVCPCHVLLCFYTTNATTWLNGNIYHEISVQKTNGPWVMPTSRILPWRAPHNLYIKYIYIFVKLFKLIDKQLKW